MKAWPILLIVAFVLSVILIVLYEWLAYRSDSSLAKIIIVIGFFVTLGLWLAGLVLFGRDRTVRKYNPCMSYLEENTCMSVEM